MRKLSQLVVLIGLHLEPVNADRLHIPKVVAIVQEYVYFLVQLVHLVYHIDQLLAFGLRELFPIVRVELVNARTQIAVQPRYIGRDDTVDICDDLVLLHEVPPEVEYVLLQRKYDLHQVDQFVDFAYKLGGVLFKPQPLFCPSIDLLVRTDLLNIVVVLPG